jgi:hypothetical protein
VSERFGTFVHGCTRRKDVIDHKDAFAGDLFRALHSEGASHIVQTDGAGQLRLRPRVASANQIIVGKRKPSRSAYTLGQK